MADFPNYVGFAASILGFMLLYFIKGNEHWRISVLCVGIMLVFLASFSFWMFTDMHGLFEILAQQKKIDETTGEQAKKIIGVWVFVLPAVIGAIGANLISSWFLAKKP